ncbi:hypothetical protein C5E06_11595 [Pseudoclavibacter sp. RFBI5]|nr:hypothetical protein C5E05_00635 [Pseudoclavibacter sp. AY1H1]PPG03062.1 hypothetical protein C5E06_11595 [Pseudoclavibacter sp. RFBI5]
MQRWIFVSGQPTRTADANPAPPSQTTTRGAGIRVKSAVQAAADSRAHHCHASTCKSSVTAISRHHEPT